jgi:hypothetical protein
MTIFLETRVSRLLVRGNVLVRESRKLGNSQAGIEQCPDNETLSVGLTC